MSSVWISFATEDNLEGDIDYIAQEISRAGLKTRLHPLFPGEDDKIARLMRAFLTRPEQSSAWILYASPNTLADRRAEHIAAAVDSAMATRADLPVIGLFCDPEMVTTANRIQFGHKAFIDDPEWRDKLGTALGVSLQTNSGPPGSLTSYMSKLHSTAPEPYRYAFEFRPRMGRWDPVLFAIPPEEKRQVAPIIGNAAFEEGFSDDAEWYFLRGNRPATPRAGYITYLRELPSRLAFGQEGTDEVVILSTRPAH